MDIEASHLVRRLILTTNTFAVFVSQRFSYNTISSLNHVSTMASLFVYQCRRTVATVRVGGVGGSYRQIGCDLRAGPMGGGRPIVPLTDR